MTNEKSSGCTEKLIARIVAVYISLLLSIKSDLELEEVLVGECRDVPMLYKELKFEAVPKYL